MDILFLGLEHGEIYALDTQDWKIKKSSIKGPTGSIHAIMAEKKKKKHLATY